MMEAVRIAWRDTGALLEQVAAVGTCAPARAGTFRVTLPGRPDAMTLRPAACLPPPSDGESAEAWIARCPGSPGNEWVVLLQAGAAAVGAWVDGRPIDTKVFKRYVTRGNGRAQPTHLRVKGKSRYGSRLRLQQAEALLDDLCARLTAWEEQDGAADTIHWSCVPRLWDDLLAHRAPPPPFTRHDPRLRRIRIDVREPGEQELLRVRHQLQTTRLDPE